MSDKNGNDDYLYEAQCPGCGEADWFLVECSGNHEWEVNDSSIAAYSEAPLHDERWECGSCDWRGTFGDMEKAYEEKHGQE